MRVYIAGPMTGLPGDNYPAFHAAAQQLRQQGHHVENPAESAPPPCGGTWLGWMRQAVAQLVSCDEICLLPGWEHSRGARVEHELARGLGLRISHLQPPRAAPAADLATPAGGAAC